MIDFRIFAGTMALAGALCLAGCAAPRTPEADAAVHKVVIVTLLDESGPFHRIGLTIFNDAATSIPQDGALSKAAVDEITQRLHRARPGWEIVPPCVDLKALGEKYKGGNSAFSDVNAKIHLELDDIVKRTGADAVFLVADTNSENSPGRGVGVELNKLPGLDGVVVVHAHVYLEMLDKAGKRLSGAPGAETPPRKASDFGLTGDIDSVEAPGVSARLSEAMRAELVRDIDAALQRMGY